MIIQQVRSSSSTTVNRRLTKKRVACDSVDDDVSGGEDTMLGSCSRGRRCWDGEGRVCMYGGLEDIIAAQK